jgi:hypothetical protein
MKLTRFVLGVALVAASSLIAVAQPASTHIALDTETIVDGVGVGCTGIGQTKFDPRWSAYSVRIEFSDAQNAYLADEVATVWDAQGRAIASVGCEGPWILFKLPAGAYRVEGRLTDQTAQPRTASFNAPARGQLRVILKFPDA